MSLLTIAQVAERLSVSRTTSWRMIRDGIIPSIEVTPSMRRVDPADLEDWIAERRQRGTAFRDQAPGYTREPGGRRPRWSH